MFLYNSIGGDAPQLDNTWGILLTTNPQFIEVIGV